MFHSVKSAVVTGINTLGPFGIWTITDLSKYSIKLFLFGDAYTSHKDIAIANTVSMKSLDTLRCVVVK